MALRTIFKFTDWTDHARMIYDPKYLLYYIQYMDIETINVLIH
mgnify:CR=1 FL=1